MAARAAAMVWTSGAVSLMLLIVGLMTSWVLIMAAVALGVGQITFGTHKTTFAEEV